MSEHTKIAPKSFISHASEDKPEFATPLATALLATGVDVWIDEWEMGPGDSLIQKIFSEGIKNSDAVVIILSATSITKPWVQKELNVAAVNNIQSAMKLIPVRVDESEVHEVLKDLFWIDWHKAGSAVAVAKRIADVLFGVSRKPTLGTPPPHLSTPRFTIPGLHPQDIKVLEVIFYASLENLGTLIQAGTIMPLAEKEGISFDQVKESIQMLEQQGFLADEDRTLAGRHIVVKLHPGQHLKLAESLGYPVESMIKRSVAAIANGQAHNLHALTEVLADIPMPLLDSIIRVLSGNGFWDHSGTIDGNQHIFNVSVKARRWLEENS
ncbi:MAG: toll/interleukin-1 receptor domain-containing protein [Fimbriimonadaceae bacterium]|nr:toll/interleukin-1 receptor domain-containing protein [Fimbriimonadaceae bacterium]QYK59126.1 MAG: toll/interleukin-1 receptor domain-containing protein [Fimbriimonadaceae bacterium]